MNNKLIVIISIIVVFCIGIIGGILLCNNRDELIEYKGKKYAYLEYKQDGFVYDYISDRLFEVDKTYSIKVGKWDAAYCNGDVFIIKNKVKEATKYYSDDENYNWYFVLDKEDSEVEYKITLTKDEIDYLYSLDSKKKEKTIVFDDIDSFGSVKKLSKDKSIYGIITVAKVKDTWYWKSEVMMDDTKEFVVALPDSLNKKIEKVIGKTEK